LIAAILIFPEHQQEENKEKRISEINEGHIVRRRKWEM
jgi:hypothetical protein